MMSSPLPTLGLCIFYAYFSKSLAPRLMQNRKAFDLRNILVFYNLFQTIFSTWIFYEVSHLFFYYIEINLFLFFGNYLAIEYSRASTYKQILFFTQYLPSVQYILKCTQLPLYTTCFNTSEIFI